MKILSKSKFFLKKIEKLFFPFYKKKEINKLFNVLQEGTAKETKVAMFVGGCVRKHLSGENIDDIDIACIFSPKEIKDKLKNTKFKIIDTGLDHGSLTIILNQSKFEVTTLRKDITTDGRHAEVLFTDDWSKDSQRRDFTINSIYMDHKGNIFDPQSGKIDLKKKEVKFIGEPSVRIEEDYLRIIRFIRFSIQYSCEESDSKALDAIKLNLNGIKKLSKERIISELYKIFKLKNTDILLKNTELRNIFSIIFPEFKYLDRLKKLSLLFEKHILIQNPEFICITLLIDETDNYEYFCHKYKTSNKLKNELGILANNYMTFKADNNFLKRDIKKNTYLIGKNNIKRLVNFIYCSNFKFSEKLREEKIVEIDRIRIPPFPFNGQLLKDEGVIDGKKIGFALKELEDEWVKNNFKLDQEQITNIINKAKDSNILNI